MKKRFYPYLWVTRLAALLANEKSCKYAVSLLAKYQFDKHSSNYDSSEHDEMVIQRAAQLQAEGFTVYVENANSFKVNGQKFDICIAGRPDIVAIKDGWTVVEDCKSGKPKDSHRMQVLLYMLLLPAAKETKEFCQNGKIPHGRLIYKHTTKEIPAYAVDQEFKNRLHNLIAAICDIIPPKPNASIDECRYCSIPKSHCPSHISMSSNRDFVA